VSRRSATQRRSASAAAAAALILLAGCGESPSSPAQPAPQAERPPTSPAPSSSAKRSKGAERSAPSAGKLRVADPDELPGEPVPRYLPKGFVLPAPATVEKGIGTPKPDYGFVYLTVDAPLDELVSFLKREYKAKGWKEITDQTIEEDGKRGANLLFTKGFQRSAGFNAQEDGSRSLVQAQYNNPPKR